MAIDICVYIQFMLINGNVKVSEMKRDFPSQTKKKIMNRSREENEEKQT